MLLIIYMLHLNFKSLNEFCEIVHSMENASSGFVSHCQKMSVNGVYFFLVTWISVHRILKRPQWPSNESQKSYSILAFPAMLFWRWHNAATLFTERKVKNMKNKNNEEIDNFSIVCHCVCDLEGIISLHVYGVCRSRTYKYKAEIYLWESNGMKT